MIPVHKPTIKPFAQALRERRDANVLTVLPPKRETTPAEDLRRRRRQLSRVKNQPKE